MQAGIVRHHHHRRSRLAFDLNLIEQFRRAGTIEHVEMNGLWCDRRARQFGRDDRPGLLGAGRRRDQHQVRHALLFAQPLPHQSGIVAAAGIKSSVDVAAAWGVSFCLGVTQQQQTAHGEPDRQEVENDPGINAHGRCGQGDKKGEPS